MKASLRLQILQRDTGRWRLSAVGLWLAVAFWLTLLAIGMPTGIGTGFDIMAVLIIHTFAFLIVPWVIAWLLTVAKIQVPRYFTGCLLYSWITVYSIMYKTVEYDMFASIVLTSVMTLTAVLAGLLIRMVFDRMARMRVRMISAVLVCGLTAAVFIWPLHQLQSGITPDNDVTFMDATGERIPADNPSSPGDYRYQSFTYSSGSDKHRPEFGEGTTLVSDSVDASRYITNWRTWRTAFWGFDEQELPLNGRVWMPEGDGPFPLVLIVHGNHTMEEFSDEGYAYLGELLASRGMIAISVDQNYLNYSHWSGIPNDDYKLRAWILLQHIKQIGVYHREEESPFYGKVDMHNVAIIGHSRGGQAAAMAADSSRWFTDDPALPDPDSYTIQAVAALAPTDTDVDKKAPKLRDVYYMTIYGGRDADVNTLKGDEQYSRVELTEDERFKAALFIENANHSFFNSSWGPNDLAMPKGIFLNQQDTMDREAQEMVTKLYISAFLEIVFHGKREYEELLRDYRSAGNWLPDSRYANRYQSGAFKTLTNFDQDDAESTALYGSEIVTEGLSEWDVAYVTDKNGRSKGTKGAVVEFLDEAELTFELSEQYREQVLEEDDTVFTFSIMNAEHKLELAEEAEASEEPEIVIELETDEGETASFTVTDYADIAPMPETTYTTLPMLEERLKNGKYKNNQTPVFQTVEIPLEDFEEVEGDIEPEELERITFHFDDGPARIVLDDIGFVRQIYH